VIGVFSSLLVDLLAARSEFLVFIVSKIVGWLVPEGKSFVIGSILRSIKSHHFSSRCRRLGAGNPIKRITSKARSNPQSNKKIAGSYPNDFPNNQTPIEKFLSILQEAEFCHGRLHTQSLVDLGILSKFPE
jgi:hypothetical protein